MRRCRDINPDQHHRIPPFAVQRTIDESKPDSPSIEFKPGRRPNPSPAVTTPRPPSRPPPAPPATIPPPPTIRIEHSPIRIEYAPLRIEHSEIKIDHGPRIPIHAVGRMQRESDSAMIRQKTECEIVRHIAGMGFPGPMVREVLRKTGTNNIHQVELAVDVLLQK
ncbi:hypothetical protein K470DRAFT_161007 [Piedraia hortae CBS 480.64]|uniref:UBA domain-containing protein n=1 Tax=Piedraia hortae CBS 480.64 TaxID=1314780 RepID=A0A6A7BR07_9PEZI|nr:hypothetical protein K470DRAFT_161007 [Piedraia hortae CBS 480.64]